MEEAWTPVPLDEVKNHIKYLQDMAEMIEAGLWEAVRYEHDGFNISFRVTPAGIRQLEADRAAVATSTNRPTEVP